MSENLLQLLEGGKSFGSRNLFEEASFSVNEGEHVGVIGPNGAGKTTLFRILAGEDELDSGRIVRSRQLSLGYLSQHDRWNPEETGNSFLERTSTMPVWDLKTLGRSLQLSEPILSRNILSLSGGYRMRIKLLGLLGQEPNLMLLDEPTNYLDLETTLVLERFLQGYAGAFLLISHDREFLRRTTDHILEVEAGEMTKFNGNIDDYFEQKELLRAQLESSAATQQKKRKDILDFVARFGAKATKAKQAQSRLKSLAKMEAIEVRPLPVSATVRIPAPGKTGKMVLSVADASFGYGEKTVLSRVSLQVHRGDHVAVVGLNGAGKSTLLKGISGALAPLSGSAELGLGVEVAFFAQHVIEALDPQHTVLESLQAAAHRELLPQQILDLAGSLLFSGDDVKKRVSVLSGGEKSRVALGRVLLRKAPCLVLDEPTNHLDFSTVEALTNALRAYEGTVIVVSHDRGFVKRVGTKILEVSTGAVRLYPGTYEEYVWSVQQKLSDEPEEPRVRESGNPEANAVVGQKPENWKEKKKKLDRELRAVEKRLADCESELQDLQALSKELNQKIAAAASPSMDWVKDMSEKAARIEVLEALWLQLAEERESWAKAIAEMVGSTPT
ncbi:MAG TPA: ATP-binding cassette domain-containing protein [Bdellovibrionota bacterium]|jgi:ATP-binding cassette subfamily F protein 3